MTLTADEFRARLQWAVDVLGRDPERLIALAEEVEGVEPEAPEVEEVAVEPEPVEEPAEGPVVEPEAPEAEDEGTEGDDAEEAINLSDLNADEAVARVGEATDAELERAVNEDTRKTVREAALAELERRDAEKG